MMFDEQPDGDIHGECAAEIHKLEAENAALRAELAAAKEYHEAYREEMLEQLGELAALKSGDVVMVPNWIPVADRLPKGGYPVLVACGKKIIRAAHAGKFELDEENWGWFNGGEGGDYNEANDTYYWPEGWYEWNEFEETHWQVESDPTHWMPLPAAPGVQAGEKDNAGAEPTERR